MNRYGNSIGFAAVVLALACSPAAFADTASVRTYVGPEGGKWSAAENWQDGNLDSGVPENGDTVIVGTTSENDIAGLSVARIEIAEGAAVTLTGNELSIAADKGGTDNDAACGIYVPESSSVDFRLPLSKPDTSGSTDCYVRGGGVVNQHVPFTNFRKKLKPNYVFWHIWNCDAFYGPAGGFVYSNNKGGLRLHNASVSRPVYANADRNSYPNRCAVAAVEGVCGVADLGSGNPSYPRAEAGATLVIGKCSCSSGVTPCGGGVIVITNLPWKAVQNFGAETIPWGVVRIHTSDNHLKTVTVPPDSVLELYGAYALNATETVTNSVRMKGGTVRLYADQAINGFTGDGALGADADAGAVQAVLPATLTFVQNADQTADEGGWLGVFPYGGTLDGPLSIVKRGAATTVLGGRSGVRTFALSGSLSVTEGILGLVNADFTSLSAIAVSGTGTKLAAGGSVSVPLSMTLSVEDGAVLEIADGLTVGAGKAAVGGTTLADGTYGSSRSMAMHVDDVHFAGTGVLTVGAGDAASVKTTGWTGAAGTADWSDAGNWSNGMPAFGDTVVIEALDAPVTFNNDIADLRLGGLSLTVGTDVRFTGNRFRVADSGFTLTTVESDPVRTYEVSFDAPVTFTGDQTWDVSTNATLRFMQTVVIGRDGALTKTGKGTLRFDAANVMTGPITVDGGCLQIYAPENGLGDGTATVTVWGSKGKDANGVRHHDAELRLYGATLKNAVCPKDQASAEFASIRAMEGENAIEGKILTESSWYPTVASGASLALAGGVNDGYLMRAIGGGTLIIRDVPINVRSLHYYDDGSQAIQWIVSTNVAVEYRSDVKAHIVGRSAGMKITTTVPYAFDSRRGGYPGSGYLTYFNGTFDVNGNPQCIGGFGVRSAANAAVKPGNGTLTNSSPTAATLELFQNLYDGNPVYGGRIGGPLTILKSGQYPLTLGLPDTDEYADVTAIFDTTGDLCVTQGVLTVNAKARFTGIGAVRVSGTGTLDLEAGKNLPETAKLFYDNEEGAVISVAAGVVIRVSEYRLNGRTQPPGYYPFGSGSVRVGDVGFTMVVR